MKTLWLLQGWDRLYDDYPQVMAVAFTTLAAAKAHAEHAFGYAFNWETKNTGTDDEYLCSPMEDYTIRLIAVMSEANR